MGDMMWFLGNRSICRVDGGNNVSVETDDVRERFKTQVLLASPSSSGIQVQAPVTLAEPSKVRVRCVSNLVCYNRIIHSLCGARFHFHLITSSTLYQRQH